VGSIEAVSIDAVSTGAVSIGVVSTAAPGCGMELLADTMAGTGNLAGMHPIRHARLDITVGSIAPAFTVVSIAAVSTEVVSIVGVAFTAEEVSTEAVDE